MEEWACTCKEWTCLQVCFVLPSALIVRFSNALAGMPDDRNPLDREDHQQVMQLNHLHLYMWLCEINLLVLLSTVKSSTFLIFVIVGQLTKIYFILMPKISQSMVVCI